MARWKSPHIRNNIGHPELDEGSDACGRVENAEEFSLQMEEDCHPEWEARTRLIPRQAQDDRSW
jgi:hypothetical protein